MCFIVKDLWWVMSVPALHGCCNCYQLMSQTVWWSPWGWWVKRQTSASCLPVLSGCWGRKRRVVGAACPTDPWRGLWLWACSGPGASDLWARVGPGASSGPSSVLVLLSQQALCTAQRCLCSILQPLSTFDPWYQHSSSSSSSEWRFRCDEESQMIKTTFTNSMTSFLFQTVWVRVLLLLLLASLSFAPWYDWLLRLRSFWALTRSRPASSAATDFTSDFQAILAFKLFTVTSHLHITSLRQAQQAGNGSQASSSLDHPTCNNSVTTQQHDATTQHNNTTTRQLDATTWCDNTWQHDARRFHFVG